MRGVSPVGAPCSTPAQDSCAEWPEWRVTNERAGSSIRHHGRRSPRRAPKGAGRVSIARNPGDWTATTSLERCSPTDAVQSTLILPSQTSVHINSRCKCKALRPLDGGRSCKVLRQGTSAALRGRWTPKKSPAALPARFRRDHDSVKIDVRIPGIVAIQRSHRPLIVAVSTDRCAASSGVPQSGWSRAEPPLQIVRTAARAGPRADALATARIENGTGGCPPGPRRSADRT